jgi:hypothetical protein
MGRAAPEDAGEKVTPEVPPAYGSGDFLKPRLLALRGKLDVPKERFIAFTEVPGRAASRRSTAGRAGPRSSAEGHPRHRRGARGRSVPLADRIGLLDSAWRLLPDVAREDAAAATRLKAELQASRTRRHPTKEGPKKPLWWSAPIEDDEWKKRFPPTEDSSVNVGDCVPFYFSPRSIMLFKLHRPDTPEITYRGGQGPIVHLEADLGTVVAWANQQQRCWAFSLSNAGAFYTQFRNSQNDLHHIDWDAVASNNFSAGSYTPSGNQVKEGKQAEFLLHNDFPWSLVQRIGVASQSIAIQAQAAIANAAHSPQISVQPSWYF